MVYAGVAIHRKTITSYLVHLPSMKDAVEIMEMIFDLLKDSGHDFRAQVGDTDHAENGWEVRKSAGRYLFQLSVTTPMNGFVNGSGAIYSYKVGNNPKKVDWPGVEFGKLPEHCFLTRDQVEPLVYKLRRATDPGGTAGFTYNPSEWALVSGPAVDPGGDEDR